MSNSARNGKKNSAAVDGFWRLPLFSAVPQFRRRFFTVP